MDYNQPWQTDQRSMESNVKSNKITVFVSVAMNTPKTPQMNHHSHAFAEDSRSAIICSDER